MRNSTRDDDRELTNCFLEMGTSNRMPLELAGIEMMVDTSLSQQFIMGAPFHYAAIIDHQNLIGIADSAEAVSNNKTRLLFHET